MRQSALLYLGANPTKWLRRAIEVIDDEVAALCRRHWEQPRVAMLRIPVSGRAPLTLPIRADYRDGAARR